MKKILKVLVGIVGAVYLCGAILVTVCLLAYNQYGVTELFGYSILIVDDELNAYTKGDLLLVKKNDPSEIKAEDSIFFYEITNGVSSVNLAKVENVEKITDTETTIIIEGEHNVSSEYLIGKTETTKVYSSLGAVLSIFESKYGFLLLIVLPILLLFFYQLYRVIIEIKTPLEEEKDDSVAQVQAPVTPAEPVVQTQAPVTQVETVSQTQATVIPAEPVVQAQSPVTPAEPVVQTQSPVTQVETVSQTQATVIPAKPVAQAQTNSEVNNQ